jgi:hypothetical protein
MFRQIHTLPLYGILRFHLLTFSAGATPPLERHDSNILTGQLGCFVNDVAFLQRVTFRLPHFLNRSGLPGRCIPCDDAAVEFPDYK